MVRAIIVWLGWSLGALSLGFSVTVAAAYMQHWRVAPGQRSIVLPIHVVGTAIAYSFLSAFVVLTRQWLDMMPDVIVYVGFTGIIIGTISLGAVCVHVYRKGPMYRSRV